MENSSFLPTPLTSPGLVVLSQAGALPDALRLQRPFTSVSEAKDLLPTLSSASLLRPLEYQGIPLLPFPTPPFLPHHLDPRLPFAPSAFHPLHHDKPFAGSAFQPPLKCSKPDGPDGVLPPHSTSSLLYPSSLLSSLDQRTKYLNGLSPGGGGGGLGGALGPGHGPLSAHHDEALSRRESPSPRGSHGSRESPNGGGPLGLDHRGDDCGRDTDTPNSCTSEEGRNRRKKNRVGDSCCPVCGISLRPGEVEAHLSVELDKLARLPTARPQVQRTPTPTPSSSGVIIAAASSSSTSACPPSIHMSPLSPHLPLSAKIRDPGWDTYQRIRANRQGRLRAKKRRCGRSEEATCPVCNERVAASTQEEFNMHVDHCFRKNGEEEVVDVEGDGPPFDDFDWRRGATAGGLVGRPGAQAIHGVQEPKKKEDNPEDRNTSHTSDDQHNTSMESATSDNSGDPSSTNNNNNNNNNNGSGSKGSEKNGSGGESGGGGGGEGGDTVNSAAVIEALRTRLRELEAERERGNKFTCLICHGEYENPLVSVSCWHVHCEPCWLQALQGTKKLCPQCNVIVSPSELRRIFL
ncbi:E3 ubiquitin-protein ligase Rnf220-like [Oratosquilla oratoria]|uniref:E3 ubiquitin-protein ligase Rnf220-like n=1 Tax=Oratosquilla oratoria TaxID=337810 RepID=UPI003F77231D